MMMSSPFAHGFQPNRSSLTGADAMSGSKRRGIHPVLASQTTSTPSLSIRSGVIQGESSISGPLKIDGLSAAVTPTSPPIHRLPLTMRSGCPVLRAQTSVNAAPTPPSRRNACRTFFAHLPGCLCFPAPILRQCARVQASSCCTERKRSHARRPDCVKVR